MLAFGERKDNAGAWCTFSYTDLPGLAKNILVMTTDDGIFEDYRQDADLGEAIARIRNKLSNGRTYKAEVRKDWEKLEAKANSWPEMHNALKRLLKRHQLPLTKGLGDAVAEAEYSYQLITTGKQGYGVFHEKGPARARARYFDTIEELIAEQMTTAHAANHAVLVGDEAIAQFMLTDLGKLTNSPYRADLHEMYIGNVEANRWSLPLSLAALKKFRAGHSNLAEM